MPQRFKVEIQTCDPGFQGTGIPELSGILRRLADSLDKNNRLDETRLMLPDGTVVGKVTWNGQPTCDTSCCHGHPEQQYKSALDELSKITPDTGRLIFFSKAGIVKQQAKKLLRSFIRYGDTPAVAARRTYEHLTGISNKQPETA